MALPESFNSSANVGSDETSQRQVRASFNMIAPTAHKSVCDAWVYACVRTGINPLYVGTSSNQNHIPMAFIVYYENGQDNCDLFGTNTDSALVACAMILYRLNNAFLENNSQIIPEYAKREQIFYRAFLETLCECSAAN